MNSATRALLVFAPQRRADLLRALDGCNLQVHLASSLREAERKLGSQTRFDLILVDEDLPDGTWRELLENIHRSKRRCEMIVCSRCGNEQLWADVLHFGAYDLIVEPYERPEVERIVQSAIDSQYMRRITRSVA